MSEEEAIMWLREIKRHGSYPNEEIADYAIDMAVEALERPDRTGKWIAVDSYSAYGGDEVTWYIHGNPIAFHYCSICKEQTYIDEDGKELLTAYCPFCGAKMEDVQ